MLTETRAIRVLVASRIGLYRLYHINLGDTTNVMEKFFFFSFFSISMTILLSQAYSCMQAAEDHISQEAWCRSNLLYTPSKFHFVLIKIQYRVDKWCYFDEPSFLPKQIIPKEL